MVRCHTHTNTRSLILDGIVLAYIFKLHQLSLRVEIAAREMSVWYVERYMFYMEMAQFPRHQQTAIVFGTDTHTHARMYVCKMHTPVPKAHSEATPPTPGR